MQKFTAAQFRQAIELDPAWASTLTAPVEIVDYCDMTASGITHLSPLLHFTGRDEVGDVATFTDCRLLRTAEGTFEGLVRFDWSGVRKIDSKKLIINQPSKFGNAAHFSQCEFLKIAEGTFPGLVNFSNSTIENIDPENLIITQPNKNGEAAWFHECHLLKTAEGTFPGSVPFSNSGIKEIGNLVITPLIPNDKYIHIRNTPLEHSAAELKKLVRMLFSRSSIPKLEVIRAALPEEEEKLAAAITQFNQERLLARESLKQPPLDM